VWSQSGSHSALMLHPHPSHLYCSCLPAAPAAPPAAGVVLTIEPGLYIPDEPAVGPFRGIGVRIEDDVAITGGLGFA
jgi:Xaa-Pro aminopeptidase